MVKEERFSQYIVIFVAIVAVVGIVVMITEQAKTWEQDILGQAVQTATKKSKTSETSTSTTIDITTLDTLLESSTAIASISSNIETLEDRVLALEEQVSDLEQTVNELSSEGGPTRGSRSESEETTDSGSPLEGEGYF